MVFINGEKCGVFYTKKNKEHTIQYFAFFGDKKTQKENCLDKKKNSMKLNNKYIMGWENSTTKNNGREITICTFFSKFERRV